MFPYRRQGPKKRKNGPPRNKVRGPQKGLPNSARDLLPILQSATKALAQMLAGRTRASGQLGHAESTLAQAERLIGERAHNRLNPAEREEFFEQLARLKLTLADAAAEAEAQAAEDQQAKPPARQVAQERLKEMALSLSQPERPAGPAPAGANGGAPPAEPATGDAPHQAEPEPAAPSESADGPPAAPTRSEASGRPGRLQLPRASAEAAATAVATGVGPGVRRRSRPAAPREATASSDRQGRARGEDDAGSDGPPAAPGQRPEQAADAQEAGQKEHRRLRKPKHKGVPEGWVIDEEGFVVPGTT